MRTTPAKTGFSLVELLVVIAIIALLMGIVLPVLRSGRESARAAVCGSNIRQIMMANHVYALDNHERFVLAAYQINTSNLDRWHGTRETTGEAFNPQQGPMSEYLGETGQVKRCPSFDDFRDDQPGEWTLTFEAGCGGYGYNDQYIGGVDDDEPAKTSDVKDASATIGFTDAGMLRQQNGVPFVIEYSFAEAPLNEGGWPATPSLHFRHHNQTASVAWVDGHVSTQQIEWSDNPWGGVYLPGADEQEMMRLGSGWFGPANNRLFDLE